MVHEGETNIVLILTRLSLKMIPIDDPYCHLECERKEADMYYQIIRSVIAKQKLDVRGVMVRADAEVTSEKMVEFERFCRAGVVILLRLLTHRLDKYVVNSDNYESLPDMVIVGLQEVTMSATKALTNYLTGERWSETMEDNLSGKYEKVESVALLGIVLNVFVKLNSAWALKNAEVERKMTGLAGLYGNKGGVIMKFELHDLTFCIVNAHFHAHDKGLEYRINDFQEINKDREKLCPPKSDFIFWLGDLNFRIVENNKYTSESIAEFIKNKDYHELLANEQLKVTKDAGKIFKDYKEASIKFAPTFKLNVDQGTYNLKRRPSWTDRVLYKSQTKKNIEILAYNSLENYTRSDHFPVMAQYKIKVPDNNKK